MKAMASFSSGIGSVAFTMFWNMNLLEVKRQVGGDDADVEQVLHVLKLLLLEVAEDVQALRETTTQSEVIGSSVVDIVAESSRHHGEGIEIGVVLPQLPCLRTHIVR
ncbi:hypothetical protein EYF80_039512 [Liparis tanakae]|uniref:Uncharacterized protein n=1 Tax=Liparis tanakae TaxID=230148 RepID=A0A4Z2G9Q6_9TELE|nr:hypothetical protein EYF80_039512 [Liparis tanakae]